MLESSEFTTIAELAERERIAPSYMTRVLRLTLLAPDIVDAILDGKQGSGLTLARVLEPFAEEWSEPRCFLAAIALSAVTVLTDAALRPTKDHNTTSTGSSRHQMDRI